MENHHFWHQGGLTNAPGSLQIATKRRYVPSSKCTSISDRFLKHFRSQNGSLWAAKIGTKINQKLSCRTGSPQDHSRPPQIRPEIRPSGLNTAPRNPQIAPKRLKSSHRMPQKPQFGMHLGINRPPTLYLSSLLQEHPEYNTRLTCKMKRRPRKVTRHDKNIECKTA